VAVAKSRMCPHKRGMRKSRHAPRADCPLAPDVNAAESCELYSFAALLLTYFLLLKPQSAFQAASLTTPTYCRPLRTRPREVHQFLRNRKCPAAQAQGGASAH
jgi:hypothetical protein